MIEMKMKAVGIVHSELKSFEDCPLQEHEQAPSATIEIEDEYLEGIKNIKSGDQLILLTWLHKSDRSVLTTQPRNNPKAAMTGVFSTRSPDRPNPVGLHFVEVIKVNGKNIEVSALEVLDQTPVIDIKLDLTGRAS